MYNGNSLNHTPVEQSMKKYCGKMFNKEPLKFQLKHDKIWNNCAEHELLLVQNKNMLSAVKDMRYTLSLFVGLFLCDCSLL